MDFEHGLASMLELVEWARVHDQLLTRNEAQTRRDLIDRLLASLDWPTHEIRVEVHHEGKYSDYELGSPATRLLVEAKREGSYFSLPAGWSDRTAKISTVVSGSAAVLDAVNQALDYALRRGIPYAAISNGWQLVAFMANRLDGVAPIDGDALVYPSPQSMCDDFRSLWDNLSRSGTGEQNLSRLLAKPRTRMAVPRLSAKTPNYPGVAHRHESQQTLQILGSVFVEDLASLEENERRFLISCYSPSGALSQYALVSREILRTRYSLLFDDQADYSVTPASSHTGIDPNLLADIAAASLKQRPIILLGDVGVGKSSFVRNLIHVEAREQLEQAIVLYLDFGRRPALTQDLARHVAGEIKRQLERNYSIDINSDAFVRGVYHGKLEQFRSSIYGALRDSSPDAYLEREIELLASLSSDLDEHLKFSLDHISKAHRKQVVVFLDNVDQRDASFQEQLFVIAQTMAESWPVTVFLALRPETFYESRRRGALTAYQPRTFSISPPRVEIVLKKRLSYALELLKEGGLRTRTGVEISIDLSTLIQYMETLQRSLQINDELTEFLEHVSNGNVRDALGYLEAYIGSPHVNLRRMLEVLSSGGRFVIPAQDLVKSVMLGDHEFYDPSRSPVGNVFDVGTHSPVEHFLLPILIEYLQVEGSESSSDGFIELAQIYGYTQNWGFSLDVISEALTRGLAARFISQSGFDRRNLEEAKAYRVAPCGVYTVRKLLKSFTYIDAVIDDTPITKSEFYVTLNPMSHDRETEARLRRAERFVRYLDDCWTDVGTKANSFSFDWSPVSGEIGSDIRRIRDRLGRSLSS